LVPKQYYSRRLIPLNSSVGNANQSSRKRCKSNNSQKVALVTPDPSKKFKMIKYHDNTYETLPGIKPEEIIKLNEMRSRVLHATDNYEYYREQQIDLIEIVDSAFEAMIQSTSSVDLFKQSLDIKYRYN